MLVLRRKAGEAIVLNGVITIHVLAVEGERVKLGISAPPEVVIVRSELLEGQEQPAAPVMVPASAPQGSRSYQEDESARGTVSPAVEDVSVRRAPAAPGGYNGYSGGPRPAPRRRSIEPTPAMPNPLRYR
jgi:carbon storage regulator